MTTQKTPSFKLKNVRLAFPQLFEAKTVGDDDKAAFSANFLLDPADPQVVLINKEIDRVAREKWGAKADAMLKELRLKDRTAIHNGDTKSQYDGFPGNLFVSARSSIRPLVLNTDKTPLTAADGKPYSGCYVNVVLSLYAQDNKYGKRINAVLGGVQFYADGDAFAGGRAASEDDFDDVSEGATADDLV